MCLIKVENLFHIFANGSHGLSDINLSIEKGEFVLIAGQNGSGKTTFCHHLNGLLLPSKGSIFIDGALVSKNLKKARQIVGMVFQNADSQIVGETVYADVCFGPENLKLKREEINQRV